MCGQCFRFSLSESGSFSGVALGRRLTLKQEDDILSVEGISREVFEREYIPYFSLDMDYAAIKEQLSDDATMKRIVAHSPGIRVLRQPLFETLISFILSQNNNIKRIAGLVERLCICFGEKKNDFFDFPTPRSLAVLSPEHLGEVRCGFRDKYVVDAAQKWMAGRIDGDIIRHAPLYEARQELMKIHGVGPKVADCTLLFGAARFDAFPEDVWIKRAMKELFPSGLPESAKPYAGIAQQYIFHYARQHLKRNQ